MVQETSNEGRNPWRRFKYITKGHHLGSATRATFPISCLYFFSKSKVHSKPLFPTQQFSSDPEVLTQSSQWTVPLLWHGVKLQLRTLSSNGTISLICVKKKLVLTCKNSTTEQQPLCLIHRQTAWCLNSDTVRNPSFHWRA